MKKLTFVFSFLAVAAVAATSGPKEAAKATNQFGFGFFNQVTKRTDKGNKFLSPVSAYLALSIAYNGATKQTAQEMEKVLAITGLTRDDLNTSNKALIAELTANKDFTLNIANSLWAAKGFELKSEFTKRAESAYKASVRSLDFQDSKASATINKWVSDSTKGKIDTIVDKRIDPDMVLFIINATYFDAEWEYKFKEKSRMGKFFNGKTNVEVPIMHQKAAQYKYLETKDGAQFVELPYKGNTASMIVALPPKELTVENFAKKIDAAKWTEISGELDKSKLKSLFVSLPKLDFKYEETLNASLKALGMERAFDKAQAELFDISDDSRHLYVNAVKQKTDLQVDEEGTRAAAVTSVEVGAESAVLADPFDVNRPYLFAIRDNKSGAILFLGTITEPEGGKIAPEKPRRG